MSDPYKQGDQLALLIVTNVKHAIAFYQNIFAGRLLATIDSENGLQAEMLIGESTIFLTESNEHYNSSVTTQSGGSPCSLYFYSPHVDQVFARALELGAKCMIAPRTMFWGARSAQLTDPFGHSWIVASRVEQPQDNLYSIQSGNELGNFTKALLSP